MTAPPASKPINGYRPDIDGLRALAVLAVLFYHAHVPLFSGGYVGVDVFFVISGYLITAIITRELEGGTFSILHFYERRARRILPALFAMIAFVLVAASVLFIPGDFEAVAPSALAALGFVANVYLFTQVSYFQTAADIMPLLHTWSLGVEEQFYIGLPIILVLVARLPTQWRWSAIASAALVSFIWALAKQADTDGFAFYMLPTRAWEMLAGSLLAIGNAPQIKARWLREALCWIGLAAIICAVLLYDSQTPFPGLAALSPVLGTAALIAYAPQTSVGKLLSMKGAVWIGLMSYSLYLWHWPLIVFIEYAQDAPLSPWQSAGIVVLSIAAAWASLHWIERPFRNPHTFPAKRVWQLSAGGMAALGAAALAMIALGGWQSRFTEETNRYAAAINDISPLREDCLNGGAPTTPAHCVIGADTSPTAVIWGDSHGVELGWALGEQYGAQGKAIIQRTRGSCAPALNYAAVRDPDCGVWNARVMQEIAADPSIGTVYLAGFWGQEHYRKGDLAAPLSRTIKRLRDMGKRVVLFGPVPVQPTPVPRRLALRGAEASSATPADIAARSAWFTANFPQWRAQGAEIVDVSQALMHEGATKIVEGGTPLYFDKSHLTLTGARYVLDQAVRHNKRSSANGTAGNYRERRPHGRSLGGGD